MSYGFDNVPGSGFTLRPDHRCTLADTPQCLSKILRTIDERHGERALVDVELVDRREDL